MRACVRAAGLVGVPACVWVCMCDICREGYVGRGRRGICVGGVLLQRKGVNPHKREEEWSVWDLNVSCADVSRVDMSCVDVGLEWV